MLRRAVLGLGLLATLACVASSCLSPTLPLPPPEEPDTVQPLAHDPDVWTVGGTCIPGAIVEVFNDTQSVGSVFADDQRTGRYSVEVRAKRCDLAWVKQDVEDESSGQTSFVIQEKNSAGVEDAGACK